LRYAYLVGTILTRSNLQNANLEGAVIAADFTEADLRGANLERSDIRPLREETAGHTPSASNTGVRDVGRAHSETDSPRYGFDRALYDAQTQWPDAFDPAASTTAEFVSDDDAQPLSLREIAETFTAYVGIPALLLYPLGLFMLAFQLHYNKVIALDFVNAWYAASLVSNVVIAGHGARAFLLPLAITAVIALLVAKGLNRLGRGSDDPRAPLLRYLRTVQDDPKPALIVILTLFIGTLMLLGLAEGLDTSNIFVGPASVAGGVAGGLIIFFQHSKSRYRQEMKLSRGVGERWILGGLAVAYGVGLFAVFVTALFVESKALPEVSIRGVNGEDSGSQQDGWLLSHDPAGYWYVVTLSDEGSGSGGVSGGGGGGVEWSELSVEGFCYVSSRTDSSGDTCSAQSTATPTASATASATNTPTASATATPSDTHPTPKPETTSGTRTVTEPTTVTRTVTETVSEPTTVTETVTEPTTITETVTVAQTPATGQTPRRQPPNSNPPWQVAVDPAECLKQDRQICAIPDSAIGYVVVIQRR
jgi:hypothetical protein